MNADHIIKVHNQLWSGKRRSFDRLRSGSYTFLTQNLTKQSKNTEWIKGDPENRKLTWISTGGSYVGYVREYVSKGFRVVEIHRLNPDKVAYTLKEDLCPV